MLNRDSTTITQEILKNSYCIVFDICLYSLRTVHLLQIEIENMATHKGISVIAVQPNKLGLKTIKIQINIGTRRISYPTNIRIADKNFRKDGNWFNIVGLNRVPEGELTSKEINAKVDECYNKVTNLIEKYEKAGFTNWTSKHFWDDIDKKALNKKFSTMIEDYISKTKKYTTREGYKNDLKFIKKFCGESYEELDCTHINYEWVYNFRQYCIINNQKGLIKCGESTIRKREMLIGAALNKAAREKFLMPEMIPYGEGPDKLKKIDKGYRDNAVYRLISVNRMEEFVKFKCEHPISRNIPWKISMFQCLTQNKISFRSIAKLKQSDIKGNMLRYSEKTHGSDRFIIMTKEMEDIIEYFKINYPPYQDYLFPIINREFESDEEMEKFLKREKKSCHDLNYKNRQPTHFRGEYDTKRKFDIDYIKSIMNKEFWEKDTLKAKFLFLFSYYAQGLNFIDMYKLKREHIISLEKDGGVIQKVIRTKRSKTEAKLEIAITENLQYVIDFFEKNEDLFPRVEGYLLPLLIDEEIVGNEEEYHKERLKSIRNFNLGLKKIAKKLNWPEYISKDFTSYYARHSFATHLVAIGVNSALVKQALGHKDLATTDTYVHQLESQYMSKTINEGLVKVS